MKTAENESKLRSAGAPAALGPAVEGDRPPRGPAGPGAGPSGDRALPGLGCSRVSAQTCKPLPKAVPRPEWGAQAGPLVRACGRAYPT